MGYCKRWSPPVIPIQNDLTVWKALFNDLHENLLLAGLVQTAKPGQLVIDDVAVLPADHAYAGFIEYALSDSLNGVAPVLLSLEFGCGAERMDWNTSLHYAAARTPRIRCAVSFKGSLSQTFGCPQGYSPSLGGNSGNNTLPGGSYLCNSPSRGFFGFVYGAGSRGSWASTSTRPYYAATFSLFMQRTTDESGYPTADGLALYYNGLDNAAGVNITNGAWVNANLPAAFSEYLPPHVNSKSRAYATRLPAPAAVKSANAELMLEPIYYSTPGLKQFPYLYSVNYESLAEGGVIPIEVAPGQMLDFISIGRETSMSIDTYDAQRAGLVMLFDEG